MSRLRATIPHCACLAAVLWTAGCDATARRSAGPDAALVGPASDTDWWREIGGRSLDKQVMEALANSPGIEVLAARVELARADARLLTSASQPSLSASVARQIGDRQEFQTGGERASVMSYSGGATLAWEVDFWGRVRQLRKGARQKVEAAFADEESGRLLLVAEIARLDLSRRRLASEEAVIVASLASITDSVQRLREKQAAGIIGDDLADRGSAEAEALQREVEALRRQSRLSELALDRLLGRDPGVSRWPAPPPMPNLPPLPEVVKTELLANRPDIRAAAARVASTWHLSRAATLDLLPKLQFTGLASGNSMQLSPSIDEWVAQIAPTIEIPIWDPARRAEAEASNARAKLAAAEYREVVLRAFEETAAALTKLAAEEKIQSSAERSAAALRLIHQRTSEKFLRGVVSQLEVLSDQRDALQAERVALRAKEARLAAWIDLRKASGG